MYFPRPMASEMLGTIYPWNSVFPITFQLQLAMVPLIGVSYVLLMESKYWWVPRIVTYVSAPIFLVMIAGSLFLWTVRIPMFLVLPLMLLSGTMMMVGILSVLNRPATARPESHMP
jgi:hypothetical protein